MRKIMAVGAVILASLGVGTIAPSTAQAASCQAWLYWSLDPSAGGVSLCRDAYHHITIRCANGGTYRGYAGPGRYAFANCPNGVRMLSGFYTVDS